MARTLSIEALARKSIVGYDYGDDNGRNVLSVRCGDEIVSMEIDHIPSPSLGFIDEVQWVAEQLQSNGKEEMIEKFIRSVDCNIASLLATEIGRINRDDVVNCLVSYECKSHGTDCVAQTAIKALAEVLED